MGSVVGLVAFLVPFTRFVFGYLDTLAHELGHSVAAWGFGYPAVPAFDWRYGGGVTLISSRSTPLVIVCFGALAYLVYHLRDRPAPRNAVLVFAALYTVAFLTPVHEMIWLGMGHLTELILAGVFLYRAISGSAVVHAVERPLYAACGTFMILRNLTLSWGLMVDQDARAAYGMAKGGGHWMDMSRIARDFLGIDLAAVASLFFLAAVLTPVATYWIYSALGSED